MAILDEAALQAVELESVRDEIPQLFASDRTLFDYIYKHGQKMPMSANTGGGAGSTYDPSGRPALRIPLFIGAGGNFSQITADGGSDDLGAGSGSSFAALFIPPVSFAEACSISFKAQWASDSSKKSRVRVHAHEMVQTLERLKQDLESVIQGSGAGELAQIDANAIVNNNTGSGAQTSSITGFSQAGQLRSQMVVTFYPTLGGSQRTGGVSTSTVSYVDAVNNIVYFSTALPTSTAAADWIVIVGSGGAIGDSILGLKAWNVTSNTITVAGLNRADYPGQFSTPSINLNGLPITVQAGRRAKQLIRLALGSETPAADGFVWYGNVDMEASIENLATNVAVTNQQEIKGDKNIDMQKKHAPGTFADQEIMVSIHAQPGRLDGLTVPKNWGIGELKSIDILDLNGLQIFPTYAASGGISSSYVFYFVCSWNLFSANPRANTYLYNGQIPSGYFGH
jgi:hypothetical protein